MPAQLILDRDRAGPEEWIHARQPNPLLDFRNVHPGRILAVFTPAPTGPHALPVDHGDAPGAGSSRVETLDTTSTESAASSTARIWRCRRAEMDEFTTGGRTFLVRRASWPGHCIRLP